jgi:hypothetical protein
MCQTDCDHIIDKKSCRSYGEQESNYNCINKKIFDLFICNICFNVMGKWELTEVLVLHSPILRNLAGHTIKHTLKLTPCICVFRQFPANSDRDTKVTNLLWPPVVATYIRANPRTWEGAIAMRFGVLGCEVNT